MEATEVALLIVRVSGLELGIDARQVRGLREAVESASPTAQDGRQPASTAGEGEQVPLIELAVLLGLPAAGASSRPILCVETTAGRLDLRIDAAEDLASVATAKLVPLPLLLRAAGTSPYIRQAAMLPDRLLLLVELAGARDSEAVRRATSLADLT